MTKEVATVGDGMSQDEAGRVRESAFLAAVDRIVQQDREAREAQQLQELEGYEIPDRSEVPDLARRGGDVATIPGEGRLVVSSPTGRLYQRMSEDERAVRNPDSDHYMAEWIRGFSAKGGRDLSRMALAEEKLKGLFPEMYRADTLLGDAGADGAFGTGTGATLVPRPLENLVMIARDKVAKMRRFASSLTMTRQQHNVPTAAAMTAEMVGEITTSTQGEPDLDQVPFVAKDGQVKAVASRNMLADSAINLVQVYSQRAGGALGVLEDQQFFADGDGTGNNISSRITGTAFTESVAGTLSWADVVRMYHSVPQEYRNPGEAIWLVASDVLQAMTALLASDGRQFYTGLMDHPTPIGDDASVDEGTILRRRVYEVAFPAGTIGFGSVSACYTVGTRMGIEADVSDQFLFDTRRIMWLWTQRFDGNDVDSIAFQKAEGITSVTA